MSADGESFDDRLGTDRGGAYRGAHLGKRDELMRKLRRNWARHPELRRKHRSLDGYVISETRGVYR
jgi:hypothetical protein